MRFSLSLVLAMATQSNATHSQTITFQKLFGGSGGEYISGAHQTSDSGYVIAGYTESFGAGAEDYNLVKFDSKGNLVWSKTYGGTSTDADPAFTATQDGGYAFLGTTFSFGPGAKAYLVRVDSQGNVLWSKTFGGVSTVYGSAIDQTEDGGFLVGTSNSATSTQSASIIKVDSIGNVLWTKTLSNSEWLKSIRHTKDGGFIVAGVTRNADNVRSDAYLLKWDAGGTLTWTKKIEFSNASIIKETKDGGYIVAKGGLMKLDSTGNILWLRGYGAQVYTVEETENGGFLTTGESSDFGAVDVILIQTDTLGKVLWSKTYGISGPEKGCFAFGTYDRGYFMAGTKYTVFSTPSEYYFVKMDSTGNSGCLQKDVNAKDSLYPKTAVSFYTQISTGSDNSQFVTTVVGSGGTIQTLCTSVGVRQMYAPKELYIFPNPTNEKIFVPNSQNGTDIAVFNVAGQVQQVPVNKKHDYFEADLSRLPSGIYFISVERDANKFRTKIIKY